MTFDIYCLIISPTIERLLADTRNVFADGYAGKAGATVERADADSLKLAVFRNIYGLKAGAIVERPIADRRYACGDGYLGKAGATIERAVADGRYAFRDDYLGKAGTISERTVADRRYVFRDGYFGKAGATPERKRADFCYGKVFAVSIWAVVGWYDYCAFCCSTFAYTISAISINKCESVGSCKSLSAATETSPKCHHKNYGKEVAYN